MNPTTKDLAIYQYYNMSIWYILTLVLSFIVIPLIAFQIMILSNQINKSPLSDTQILITAKSVHDIIQVQNLINDQEIDDIVITGGTSELASNTIESTVNTGISSVVSDTKLLYDSIILNNDTISKVSRISNNQEVLGPNILIPATDNIPNTRMLTENIITENKTLIDMTSAVTIGQDSIIKSAGEVNQILTEKVARGPIIEEMPPVITTGVESLKQPAVSTLAIKYTPMGQTTKYTDLMDFAPITVEDMNQIIDKFDKICGGTPFKGRGDVFIEASEASGLNPVYIFAHASLETGYGRSRLAKEKGNYFGIGAFDDNPSNALDMGDSLEEGIINGAVWIRENYYDNDQTNLYDMIFKVEYHSYSPNNSKWINDIVWIMNKYPV